MILEKTSSCRKQLWREIESDSGPFAASLENQNVTTHNRVDNPAVGGGVASALSLLLLLFHFERIQCYKLQILLTFNLGSESAQGRHVYLYAEKKNQPMYK